jgi:hypothetical protein
MAEDGHKSRALACFSAETQEKIRTVERAAGVHAEGKIALPSYMYSVVDRLRAGALEIGDARLDGAKAVLPIKLGGKDDTIELVNERKPGGNDVWKIARLPLRLGDLDEDFRMADDYLKWKKERGLEKAK